MIPKSRKFPLRTQFIAFRARAKHLSTPHFRILYHLSCSDLPNRSELSPPSRLAVIIPKKVSKLATTRNHHKRLVYDLLWPLIQPKHLDCVVIFKPLPLPSSQASNNLIISELNSLSFNQVI